MDNKKRVRRGESFGRVGLDRTISSSLKSPTRQKHKRRNQHEQQQQAKKVQQQPQEQREDNSTTDATQQQLQQQKPMVVHFNPETPREFICSHYDEDMTPEQKEERRKELWYQRHEFEEFLRDRLATIRLLRMARGDVTALRGHCPDICLRGLEPYQCNSINQELQCQREWHQRIILAEQSLQKSQQQDLPDRIRTLALERSEQAGQRARHLATLDELEIKLADAEPQLRRRSLAMAQLGMENLMLSKQDEQRRRVSLSLTPNPASTTCSSSSSSSSPLELSLSSSRTRMPVDLNVLKEWNAKFMEEFRRNGGVSSSSVPTNSAPLTLASSAATTTTDPSSTFKIDATKFGAGRKTMLSISSLSEKTAQSRLALQKTRESLLRPSLVKSGPPVFCGEAKVTTGFSFPTRRDSLVGLGRESFLAGRAAALADTAAGTFLAKNTTPTTTTTTTTSPSASTGGFRFAVRRDSLSNVDWS